MIHFIILGLDLIFLTPYKYKQHFAFPVQKYYPKAASHTVAAVGTPRGNILCLLSVFQERIARISNDYL